MTADDPAGRERTQGLLAIVPRIAQLSALMNKGRLAELAMEAAGVNIDRPAMSVLVVLHLAGEPLRIGEIAARLQVVGPHVTRQVQAIERRGLVRRVADPHDQRARLIEPTPEGSAAARRYFGTVLGWFDDALTGWSDDDRRTFTTLLDRFATDLATKLSTLDKDR